MASPEATAAMLPCSRFPRKRLSGTADSRAAMAAGEAKGRAPFDGYLISPISFEATSAMPSFAQCRVRATYVEYGTAPHETAQECQGAALKASSLRVSHPHRAPTFYGARGGYTATRQQLWCR